VKGQLDCIAIIHCFFRSFELSAAKIQKKMQTDQNSELFSTLFALNRIIAQMGASGWTGV
jgi:hypothetical protein